MSDYRHLQQQLKLYKQAGLTNIRLNDKKACLELEYQNLLALGLSATELTKIIEERVDTHHEPTLRDLKAQVFRLAGVNSIKNLRTIFNLPKSQFNFRTKQAWQKCLDLILEITKDSRQFETFKQEVMVHVNEYRDNLDEVGQPGAFAMTELVDLGLVIDRYFPKQQTSLSLSQKLIKAWLGQVLAENKINLEFV